MSNRTQFNQNLNPLVRPLKIRDNFERIKTTLSSSIHRVFPQQDIQ